MKRFKGFSLIELLVAVALFALLAIGVTFAAIDSVRNVRTLEDRSVAEGYLNETVSAMLSLKNQSWAVISANADGTEKGLVFQDNRYQIVNGAQTNGVYTVSFEITSVERDPDGIIVPGSGTVDIHTKLLTATVRWEDALGSPRVLTTQMFINDWNTERWRQTTVADFTAGTHDLTHTVNNAGGEVELQHVIFADWCKPSLSMSSYDLPGQGIVQSIVAGDGEVYSGTGQNASGISYIEINVDEADPPNVFVEGQLDGYKTNDIFGEPGFAYLATDTNAEEVVILDTSVLPYHKEGYFNAPGVTDASSVVVSNNVGYVATGSTLYAFDLSSKTGNRAIIGAGLTLSGIARSLKVRDNYLFAVTSSTTTQVQLIDITTPATKSIVGTIGVNGGAGVDVSLSEDFTRAYVATGADAAKAEVFVVDITTKTGAKATLSSYDTSGMGPRSVTVVAAPRVIVAGSGGEEYQVIDIENELAPARCGGMDVPAGVNDVDTFLNGLGTAYSYIATGDSANEFKIIKGGPGGGGDDGQGYAVLGTFISSVFDSGSAGAMYYSIDVTGAEPTPSEIRVQLRSGDVADLSGATWFGPDGTGSTYFVVDGAQEIPAIANGNRYIQYKAELTSNTEIAPVLEEVVISYQE